MASLRILYVEDDSDDAFFLIRAIKHANLECDVHREVSGERAIDYLRSVEASGESNPAGRPDLMIVDLKLPGLSGFDLLEWTREHDPWKTLPTIVLSGSSLEEDKKKADRLGATEFIMKHSEYDQIAKQVVQFILKMGLPVNIVPPSSQQ